MSQALLIPDVTTELKRFTPTEATIDQMRTDYLPLTIKDVNDVAGFQAVHSARMTVKNSRVAVEKLRKSLKADALAFGQAVDAEARRLTGLLTPIETYLADEENRIEAEKEKIRNAAKLKAEAEEKARKEAEDARIKAEQEAERQRLAAERAELDRIAAEQQAAQEKIDAENRKIDAERKRLADAETARLHAEEVERARAEAAERARVETEARLKREAEEDKARLQREAEAERLRQAETERLREERLKEAEAERARAEAMKPERDKLMAVSEAVRAIVVPSVESHEALAAKAKILLLLDRAASEIRNTVVCLIPEAAPAVKEAEEGGCPF